MFLKYVEIQGFKSFPDKTKLGFDRVLTGIVGPNGSGKSNISDAVRWVLGEQSSKSLRGGKMEDVIFGGTKTRNPMGYAQVSLCLDNKDGRIADVGDEIIVTRRYYRSGDSEYAVNGSPVRLRELREMFMDTGLGRDGYSIIGQGRIAEVVESKNTDRREIFEEASGIAKYRFRKNEAERKLAQAEDNLSRLRDIAGELESRIGPLKEQSEKAKKFLELSEQRRNLEITLYCDTVRRSHDNLLAQDEKIEIARLDYKTVEGKISQQDDLIEELYEKNRTSNVVIEESNTEIDERVERISALESQIAVLKNDIMHGERDIRSLEDDKGALSTGDNDMRSQIEALQKEASDKLIEVEALDHNIEELEKELAQFIEASAKTDADRAELVKTLTDVQQKITDMRVDIVAAQSVLSTLAEREEMIQSAVPQELERLEEEKEELGRLNEYLEQLDDAIQSKQNSSNGLLMKMQSRSGKYSEISDKLTEKDEKISRMRQRIELLNDLERSNEGFTPPVRKVLTAKEQKEIDGIVGTVGSLLTVRSGLELAIETALGAAVQNIVVSNEKTAKEAISFLKESRSGRATFLPMDTVTPTGFDHRELLSERGVVGLASELVEYDPQYNKVVDFLLGRIIVTEDLDYASMVARKSNYRVRIVTKDGQVINAGGSFTGGYSGKSVGVFSRRGEIEDLEKQIEQILNETKDDRAQKESLDKEIEELASQNDSILNELSTLREDRIRTEAEISRVNVLVEALEHNQEVASQELQQIAESREAKNHEIGTAENEIKLLQDDADRLEHSLSNADTADGFMNHREELLRVISERKLDRTELSKDAERLQDYAEDLRKRGSETLDRLANLDTGIERITNEIISKKDDINNRVAQVERLRSEISGFREKITNANTSRDENEKEVIRIRNVQNELTLEREKIASEISRLEERKTALSNDYNNYLNRLWEEYELTVAEALPLCIEFTSITDLRQQVTSIRNKVRALGNVNVAAIEEYEEVLSRYNFLSDQIRDVDESRKSLLRLIEDLETEMKQIFTVSFNEINTRFHRTFQELFGGGSADLYLSDETDILGSGIELDVQPPGKVIKNLSALSGGEKALVAIAIYMAILEVNPSPFCILDEIDSALDESNVLRFAQYLKRIVKDTQIIAITHRRGTMEAAEVLYGVTMQEDGVSKVLKLGIEEAQLVIEGERSR
ncbi:MAG: chromosome segregation protein SMC [Oscillospiraceae bacterium]|nr:chromosome segregation protein SMC [Oscillospiraceae bacterium]MBR0452142.1 chromosome segregation protein SMC [Oscillospiraceae bacterium]